MMQKARCDTVAPGKLPKRGINVETTSGQTFILLIVISGLEQRKLMSRRNF